MKRDIINNNCKGFSKSIICRYVSFIMHHSNQEIYFCILDKFKNIKREFVIFSNRLRYYCLNNSKKQLKIYLTNFNAISDQSKNIMVYSYFRGLLSFSNYKIVSNINKSDVVFFTLPPTLRLNNTWPESDEYIFDINKANHCNKPIIILDLLEGDLGLKPFFLGFHINEALNTKPEYVKLHNWFADHKKMIKGYFKREYYLDSPKIDVPCFAWDYPASSDNFKFNKIDSFDDFLKRKINLCYIWNKTSESRLFFHNCLSLKCPTLATNVLNHTLKMDQIKYSTKNLFKLINSKKNVVSIFVSRFYKFSFNQYIKTYSQSKISISLWGQGHKCRRDVEASANSVMALQENNQYVSYPWIDGINCIILPNLPGQDVIDSEKSIEKINYYLNHPKKLYQIYLAGINNCKNYLDKNYALNYVIPCIEKMLDSKSNE